MLVFKRSLLNLLNIVDFKTLKVVLGDNPSGQKKLDYLQIENVKVNFKMNSNIVVPNVFALSKYILSQLIHCFSGHASIASLKKNNKKSTYEGSTNKTTVLIIPLSHLSLGQGNQN